MDRIAYMDLSSGSVRFEGIDEDTQIQFIGSRGLAASLLYRMAGPETEPLGPDNSLIFSVGPLTGTSWPASARYVVTAKSPATGAYGYANASGHFGPALRSAGLQALVVTGRSASPVYILINDGSITAHNASDLWGRTTGDTETALRERHPRSRVSCIGPAGENTVRFASVMNDYGRAAARTGMGAVMGSKNLKAVVIVRGKTPETSAEFKALAKTMFEKVQQHPGSQGLSSWGTALLIRYKNFKGDLPAKNHQLLQFPWAGKVDAEALARYTTSTRGCWACPIRCSRISEVASGPFKCKIEGPEYETVDSLGPMVWNKDPELIIYANHLCNEMGLDTISTGVVIAFAMECKQRGLLKSKDYNLDWGDPRTITGLIEDIAYRRGLGDLLALGVRDAARSLGGAAEELAMHVKGVEIPRQEPRVAKGFGLGHATSNRGADHLYALPTVDLAGNVEAGSRLFPDLMPDLMDFLSEEHKGRLVKFTEGYSAITDSVGVCKFSTLENYALYPEDIAAGLRELGMPYSPVELMRAGERIVNLERMFNVRCGFSREQDRLPRRFTATPGVVSKFETGPDGEPVDAGVVRGNLLVDLDRMLDDYYDERGWNRNGIPTAEKLAELGLGWVAGDLPACD